MERKIRHFRTKEDSIETQACLGCYQFVQDPEMNKELLEKSLKMKHVVIEKWSVFVRKGSLLHAGVRQSWFSTLQYSTYAVPSRCTLIDASVCLLRVCQDQRCIDFQNYYI